MSKSTSLVKANLGRLNLYANLNWTCDMWTCDVLDMPCLEFGHVIWTCDVLDMSYLENDDYVQGK